MEGLADVLGEPALLPRAVIGGAEREQNVVRPEASNCVGERAERRLVADYSKEATLGARVNQSPFDEVMHALPLA